MVKGKVYISGTRNDRKVLNLSARTLRERGWQTSCMVNRICSDVSFVAALSESLISADNVLLFYSSHTEVSQWTRREWESVDCDAQNVVVLAIEPMPGQSWYKMYAIRHSLKVVPLWQNENKVLLDFLDTHFPPSLGNNPYDTGDYEACQPVSNNGSETCPSVSKTKSGIRKFLFGGILVCMTLLVMLMVVVSQSSSVGDKTESRQYSCSSSVDTTNSEDDDVPATSGYDNECNSSFVDTAVSDVAEVPVVRGDDDEFNPYDKIDEHPDYTVSVFAALCLALLTMFGGIALCRLQERKRRKTVKVTCDADAFVMLDGQQIVKLTANAVHLLRLAVGEYVFRFVSVDGQRQASEVVKVQRQDMSKVVVGHIGRAQSVNMRTIMVFIAGSTHLVNERNALRATISKMYNRYKAYHVLIEAFSFDDFTREYVVGGQQSQYDRFIKEEADWVVFVINGVMGDKTTWELQKAVDARKANGHPRILIYSGPESSDSDMEKKMSEFKTLLFKEDNYWIDYASTETICSTFREHIDWDVTRLMRTHTNESYK